jgi:hypothetical protein
LQRNVTPAAGAAAWRVRAQPWHGYDPSLLGQPIGAGRL